MKNNVLFIALIAITCSFGACRSPEANDKTKSTTGDSTTADSLTSASLAESDNDPKNETNETKADEDEATFMKTAALGGMMEVDLATLAEANAADASVKSFAAKMLKDHTKANMELKALATKMSVLLPDAYPASDKAHMEMMKKMKGKDFDRHYMNMMVKDHVKTLDLFKNATRLRTDTLKNFASTTLPILQQHHQMAVDISKKLSL